MTQPTLYTMSYLLLIYLFLSHSLQFYSWSETARCEHIALLTQLPANTKEIELALLVCQLSAKAINIPLSYNSYSPKCWAYVTFAS